MAAKFVEEEMIPSVTTSSSSAQSRFSSSSSDETCLICMEQLTDPRSLPCNHSFCLPCLQKYYHSTHSSPSKEGETAAPGTLACPVCRQEACARDLGVDVRGEEGKGSTQDAVEQMVTMITSVKRPNCDVCRYKGIENAAKDHCSTCAIDLCGACKRDHDRHSVVFRSHSAVPVAQRERSALKCELHRAETVRYFCATCLAPLCSVCAVTEHNRHDTAELSAALGNKKESIEERIYGMSEKVMRHEEMLAKLEDLQSVKEAALRKTKQEIERHVGTLMAVLQQRKQALLEELDRYHTASVKSINLEKDGVCLQLANMKSLWKFAAKLTEPGQVIQLLASYHDLDPLVDGLVKAPEPRVPREATTMMMFVPRENLTVGDLQACEMSSQLLQRVESRMNGGGKGAESPRAASPDWSREERGVERMNLKYGGAARLVWKMDKIGQRLGEINEPYDVSITPNGTVVVAEWLNQRVQVFDSTGYAKEILGQGQIQPWGVTLTRDGHIAVTDERDRTVKLFPLSSLGGSNNSPSPPTTWKKQLFGMPRGIAANRAGQFIVTDTQHGQHKVTIHLPDGKCVGQCGGSQGSGAEQFHWPRYVTTDPGDRILVSDSSNHCVKVLDPTGQFMFRFGSLGAGDGQMKHPRGVCTDPNGGVVVADQDNNRVTLFSGEGKFVRHLLSISKPWGVAVSEGGLLAVTHKQSVSLYKVFEPMP